MRYTKETIGSRTRQQGANTGGVRTHIEDMSDAGNKVLFLIATWYKLVKIVIEHCTRRGYDAIVVLEYSKYYTKFRKDKKGILQYHNVFGSLS